MKWIGQNIWSFISRFRSDVYLEDISTGTIASGSHLGLDSNNKIVKAADGGGDLTSIVAGTGLSGTSLTGPIPTLSVDAAQIHVTSVGTIGTGTWQGTGVASAYLDTDTAHLTTDQIFTGSKTFSNDTTTLTSGNANDPLLLVENTANDATSGRIRFLNNRGADGQDGDSAGMIQFYSYDDGTPSAQQYGRIQTKIDVAASGEESGDMILSVANHDGGLETGLTLTGGSVNAEVDVTIGTGAASVTTVAGTLTMGSTAALTNTGLVAVANQSSITGVGTIGTGVWEGTAIATDQQKHLMHYEFMGFNKSTANTVYEFAESMSDTKAPLEHTADHNATITTAMVVGTFFKAGGQVMPRAGTIKQITGWAHSNGTSAEHKLALVMLRPAEDDNTAVAPVLVDEITWTSLGGNKLKVINETTITAASVNRGDILMTMIKDDTGGRQVFFNITIELEV